MNVITFGQFAFTDLDFADDISLPAELLELLVPALQISQEEVAPLGLEVNWQTTMIQALCSVKSLNVSASVGTMSNVWNHLST